MWIGLPTGVPGGLPQGVFVVRTAGRHAGSTVRPSPGRRLFGGIAAALAFVLAISVAPVPAYADDTDGQNSIGVTKEVAGSPGVVPTLAPGDPVSYTIRLDCSSQTDGICVGARLVDPVPAPLVLEGATVTPAGISTVSTADNTVDVAFTQSNDVGTGMLPGTVTISVTARVPADITWQEAQELGQIDNTATFTATGTDRQLQDQSTAGIVIAVPDVLEADATKSADDNMGGSGRPIPAVSGKPVDFTIGGGNTSNRPVDSLTITDPATGSTNLEYLDLTSIGPIDPPTGADEVTVTVTDATGPHTIGPVPAPTDSIPLDGIDPPTVTSVTYVFTNSTGAQLPPASSTADYATIGVATVTNDLVLGLDPNESVVIGNVVQASVAVGDDTASDTADASVTITNTPPSVDIEKVVSPNVLLPGDETSVSIRADNTGKDVVEMTIADPIEGQPDLHAQGLVFGGFTDTEWPRDASSATIVYTYADGSTEEFTTFDLDTLPPASNPADVVGFSVTFTGDIGSGSYSSLLFDATAMPVDGDADVLSTNTAGTEVVDSDGASATDTDPADIRRRPIRVDTNVDKNIVKDELFSRPGSNTMVELPADVDPDSSVGSEYLIVQDPATPGAAPTDFWNHFDLTSVGPVDVPGNATMTVEYWSADAGGWVEFPGMPVAAGETWSYTVPSDQQDDIQGIRFTFEPAVEGELLEPGFNVIPRFKVELRDELRDGTGPASGDDVIGTIDNDAQSIVDNEDTGQGPVTDEGEDSIVLVPVDDGSGTGPDLVDKSWTPDEVLALSAADTEVLLSWGTLGLPMDTVTITDPSGAQGLPIADSVFDAFDLVSIDAITEATDPGIRFDQVYAERLTAAGAWTPVGACTAAEPCRGSFPAYTLDDIERADTVGIRFVFSERPDRATVITDVANDPAVGSGVAETAGRDRTITLHLGLRDYLRSVPLQPVLGTGHSYTYNTDTRGVVLNTVNATGQRGEDVYTTDDEDDITILDRPLNVTLDKRFVDYDENADDPYAESEDVAAVGVPAIGTPQADYPLVTALLRATNTSNTRIGTLTVTDPDPSVTDTILDEFNLYRIADISVPTGADAAASRVFLSPAIGGQTEFTIAEAELLTPAQLAGVLSVQVVHRGALAANGTYATMIAVGAETTVRLEYQLRQTNRTTGGDVAPEPGTPLFNNAITEATRPGADDSGPITESETDVAVDSLLIVEPTYGVSTLKTITPETRTETESREGYAIALTGRPSGTVRTTQLVLTDITPTFWNAFEFAEFDDVRLPNPVEQLRVDVLTGVEYDLVGGALVQTCDGDADLTDCWTEGAWLEPLVRQIVTAVQLNAALPVDPADVQGLRFTYREADGSNWERPSNPIVRAAFIVDRREYLVYGEGGGSDTEVPSTRPGLDPAPGEPAAGVFTDVVQADATGSWPNDGQPWEATATDDATTTLTHVENGISVTKVHGRENVSTNQDTFYPGEEIPYTIRIVNTGDWPITGLTLVDQVQTDAEGPLLVEPPRDFDDDRPIYTATLNGTPVTPFTGAMDAAGRIVFDLPDDFVLQPDDTLLITASLIFRQAPTPVAPGTRVENGITATSDRFFDSCEFTEQAAWQTPTQDVEACASVTENEPAAVAPIATAKSVKGVGAGVLGAEPGDANYDDLGVLGLVATNPAEFCALPNAGDDYYRTPCVPITRPGGVEQWRVELENRGNIPVSRIATIDVLPYPGDTGVILSGSRLSRWQPVFLGKVATTFDDAPAIWYSTVVPNRACNAAEIEYLTGAISSANAACTDEVVNDRPDMWQPYSEDLSAEIKAQVRALKIVGDFAPGNELRPNESVGLTFQTQTPWYADQAETPSSGVDPIAWNSAASGSVAQSTDGDVQSQVVEPRKVGVAMATGQLRLVKDVEGADPSWGIDFPDDYAFTVSCVSGGEQVELVGPTGLDASVVRVPADGTPVDYNSATSSGPVNLPLYAECTITEDVDDPASQGTVVTYDPADADDPATSGAITALRFSFASNVANPAATGDPGDATISIVNEYLPGGFRVTKAVDNGGAVNEDDEPISYDGRVFAFEVSCTFLDQTVLDDTFLLTDGADPVEYSDLPAGSECTVAETDDADAADTTIVVTEDGAAGEEQNAASTTFTVLPYADDDATTPLTTVAFTNHYTVGPVEITKIVAGAGADPWGDTAFTLEMTCTLDGVTPNPVFEDSTTLSGDDLVWRVDDLPTGAECTVTETEDGGANSSTGPITIVVGDDPETPGTGAITNTFTVGSLQVQKLLDGDPAAALDPATAFEYEVSLSCTRVVNDETVAVAIPLGPTRTIIGAGTALYEGLPTGALCTLTEEDAGHATSHEISPEGPYEIGDGQSPITVTVTNEFANGLVSVEKTVAAPEGFPVPDAFTATVSCTWQGAAVPLVDDGAVTIVPGDDPVTIPDVPVGSICTVTEDDFGQVATEVTPSSVTVTAEDQTFALSIENVYEWAALRVGKVVESETDDVPTQFEFTVTCTFQGETVLDETFWLDAGQFRDFTELPARSQCTVTESDDRSADGTVTEATVPGAEGELAPQIDQETRTVVIPELQPGTEAEVNTVTYTNLYDTAGFVLQKEFEGEGADQFGLDQTFVFTVTCVFDGETILETTLELNAENGWTAAITDVVSGSACTVVEDDLNGADAVVIEPNDGEDETTGSVVIPDGGVVTVTAVNWYLTGSLEVTKTFAGDGAEKFGTDDFGLQLSCVRDGIAIAIPDGDTRVVSQSSPSAQWANLPTGSECTLTETDTGGANSTAILDAEGNEVAGDGEGYTFTVETDPTILSVDDQAQPALQVENTFNLAQVSVTKAVASEATGIDGEPISYGPFEIELACTWNGGPVTAAEDMVQTIADGETVTWTELPEGAACTVTETDTADAESTTVVVTESGEEGGPVAATTVELAPLPNVDADDQTSVAITNSFGVASLSVSKLVDGTAASTVTRTFPIEVSCVFVDASHPDPGVIVHDAEYEIGGPSRLTAEIVDLPAGSVCTVTETDAGDADSTTMTVDGEERPGTTGSVTLTSGHVAIVFTNTFMAPLPPTGGGVAWLIPMIAVLVMAAGLVLLLLTRRRRSAARVLRS